MHDTEAMKGVVENGMELIKEGLSEEVTLRLMRLSQSWQGPRGVLFAASLKHSMSLLFS